MKKRKRGETYYIMNDIIETHTELNFSDCGNRTETERNLPQIQTQSVQLKELFHTSTGDTFRSSLNFLNIHHNLSIKDSDCQGFKPTTSWLAGLSDFLCPLFDSICASRSFSAQTLLTGSWRQTRRKPNASQRWENRCWGNTPNWRSLLRNPMSSR